MKASNKRKRIKILLLVFGLGTLFATGLQIGLKMKERNAIETRLQHIPDFDFSTLEGKPYTPDQLQKGIPTVFIYFNTECDFCQQEAKEILANIEQLKGIQFLIISEEPIPTIREFATSYKLDDYDNIIFLSDPTSDFSNRFGATSIPYVLIYDRYGTLIKRHKGQMPPVSILKYVNQEMK